MKVEMQVQKAVTVVYDDGWARASRTLTHSHVLFWFKASSVSKKHMLIETRPL